MKGVCLGIDTATPYLALALWSPTAGTIVATTVEVGRAHASRLLPTLEGLLVEAGIERTAISAVAAGTGPGSYTGLRVGAAAAGGISRALGVPLSGCDTLAAIAYGELRDGEEALVALGARRGNLYVGRYRRLGAEVLVLDGPRKAAADAVLAERGDCRLIEDAAPEPAFTARSATLRVPFRPLYL